MKLHDSIPCVRLFVIPKKRISKYSYEHMNTRIIYFNMLSCLSIKSKYIQHLAPESINLVSKNKISIVISIAYCLPRYVTWAEILNFGFILLNLSKGKVLYKKSKSIKFLKISFNPIFQDIWCLLKSSQVKKHTKRQPNSFLMGLTGWRRYLVQLVLHLLGYM